MIDMGLSIIINPLLVIIMDYLSIKISLMWVWVWVEVLEPMPIPTPTWWVFRGNVDIQCYSPGIVACNDCYKLILT